MVNEQWQFLQDVAALIDFASKLDGVKLTGGDLWQDNAWHRKNSIDFDVDTAGYNPVYPHLPTGNHPKRLAIDLNLFVQDVYITGAHPVWVALGLFWVDLDPKNRWGGDFSNGDYNHFERNV
jgi:hypothetical protein